MSLLYKDGNGEIVAIPSPHADKVKNATAGNFAGLNAAGNPTDSGKKPDDFLAQMPSIATASAELAEKIIQYVGNDTDDYKNGYFYKCVADGTAEPISYKWVQTDVQPDGGETQVQSDWEQTDTEAVDFIKNKPTLGTASAKDVATSGNASATQVVMGNDSRLTDARNAADVSAWAKAGTKPTYTASEVGLGNVVNTGDSATPVANGTTKFTTGGAYTELNKKVDKEEGKGLSSNDFTDDDKTAILNSPIPSTSTASPITDSADGMVQGLTIYGRSEVVDGEIKSVGDDGLTVTTANSDNTLTTSAEFTTALPLRGVSDTVRDKLICTADAKQVETVCGKVKLADLTWLSGYGGYYTNNTIGAQLAPTIADIVNAICSKYTTTSYSQSTNKTICGWSGGNCFLIKDDDYTIVSDFVASLGDAELIYELATPVITPLTTAEISAFRGLKTYDSTTNITITDEPDFEFDYLENTENGQAVADIQRELQGQIGEVKNATKPRVYAFYIDQNDSNPATCVHPYYNTKYGCDNLFYQNAYMDYEKDEFNYGSWENFIKEFFKPCMLAYDGHVDYYLDPDDYETKLDGGTSDIKDMTYNGNVMVQIKTLYFKRWTTGGKYYCIISDKKLDKSFKAFAHHDIKGNVLDYIYRAAYDGSYDGTRLRSISGIDYHNLNALTVNKIMSNATRQQEINFAKANNDTNEKGEGWNILHKAEWDLINDLLLLIGMSTNTQATFGNGNISSYKSMSDTGIIATGTMDKKGLFYGKNDNVSGVKVFGFEHPWGNIWKSYLGWILSANQHLVKMTPGNEDGSTATDYNLDGTGYVATGKSITANGYISAFDGADTGFLPTVASGSATTYMCDYVWQNTAIYFALVGGASDNGAQCGAFYTALNHSAAATRWHIGAALSYKPLARG